jgi:hypothetical protein
MNAIAQNGFRAGIHLDVPPEVYHADPCAYPSLSSGVGRLILRSPMHARHAHPRLNSAHVERAASKFMDDGTILHKLILGVGADVRIVEADNWTTKAAKAERDEAREAGITPILAHRYAELEECADAAREQIGFHAEASDALRDGEPEATVIWRDGVALCRARVDWLKHDPHAPLVDLKSTSASADPAAWERYLINDYAFQAAFYCRGVERIRGVRPAGMWFVVVETAPPYAISVVTPAPSLMDLAERQVEEAIRTWSECQRTNRWPGYPPQVAHVEAPHWLVTKADERDLRRGMMMESAQ